MNKWRRLSAIVSVAAVLGTIVLAAAACSSGSSSDDGGGTPRQGGQLVVAYSYEPAQINPLVNQDGGSNVTRPLVDSLVWDNGDGTYAPWLAESWTVSPDASEYVFKLRRDVKFTDGTPLNAAAVKTNFDYTADPKNKSTGSVAKLKPVATVVDDYTVKVKLGQPESSFLTLIAAAYFGIVSPKQLTENPASLANTVVGSGPFILSKWVKGQSMEYRKNPDYRWAPAKFHQGPAYLDSIKIEFLTDDQVRYNALKSREVDIADYVPVQYIEQAKKDSTLTLQSYQLPGVGFGLHLNTRRPVLSDVRVRQALLHGLDRGGIVKSASFGQYPVQEYLAATTPDFKKDLQNKITYDPQRAGRLLDEAGWSGRDGDGYRTKGGQRLSLRIPYVESDQVQKRALEQSQADARKLGVEFRLEPVANSVYNERLYNGNYDVMATAQSEATGMQLWRLYGTDNISRDGSIGSNASFISDPTLDALLVKARSASDPAERAKFYGQAQERLPELAPAVPLYSKVRVVAANKSTVHGLDTDYAWPQPYLFDVWVNK